jgi:CubicO group peptidase (beta-lactamase class C family)
VRVFGDLAGGVVDSVRIDSPTHAEIVARNATRALWVILDVELEPGEPRKIVALQAAAEDKPPGQSEPEPSGEGGPLDEAAAVRLLAGEFDRRVAGETFSGVAIVEEEGRTLFERAGGLADREQKVPVSLQTKFGIASIGKAFTQVVLHQLVAEGKLDLDATLAQALPDYPNRDIAARVTLRQLRDHTSGMGDYLEALYSPAGKPLGSPVELADYLPLFVDRPLAFEPGSKQRYSNTGYLVLGLVIEHATGKRYFDVVRERVFAPAGMTDTGWAPASADVPGRAVGYFRPERGGAWKSNAPFERGSGTSAGGAYSTARDLLRFAAALDAGKLLPAGAPPLERRGGIAGGSNGANAVLIWGGAGQPRLVVLSNLDEPSAESFARYARAVLARIR